MAKALGIKQIEMYENMIEEDFAPLITILRSRTMGIRGSVEKQVKKDFGVYDLLAEKAALTERIVEIEKQTKKLTETRGHHNTTSGKWEYISEIDKEVNRKLEELNEPLSTARKSKDEVVRGIRLSSIPTDIKTLFTRSEKILKQLNKEAKKLPAIDVGVVPELE